MFLFFHSLEAHVYLSIVLHILSEQEITANSSNLSHSLSTSSASQQVIPVLDPDPPENNIPNAVTENQQSRDHGKSKTVELSFSYEIIVRKYESY